VTFRVKAMCAASHISLPVLAHSVNAASSAETTRSAQFAPRAPLLRVLAYFRWPGASTHHQSDHSAISGSRLYTFDHLPVRVILLLGVSAWRLVRLKRQPRWRSAWSMSNTHAYFFLSWPVSEASYNHA
jgi:hypothetical protein